MEFIDGLVDYLVQMFVGLAYNICYPFIYIVNIFLGAINLIWSTAYAFVVSFYNLFAVVNNLIYSYLFMFMPNSWIVVIVLALFIVIAFRIYSFVKDIEFAGFKI